MVVNPSAPAGRATKYARPEFERRFLLSGLPPGRAVGTVAIADRYLTGSRLRLRRTERIEPAGEGPVFKLTQKVPADDGGPGLITTVYLSRAEFDLLATLPGEELKKTRHSLPPLGVDVFEGRLERLVLAEAEFDTQQECTGFSPPQFVVAEVTHDVRFTGGALAAADASDVRDVLRSFGL
jgi:CYTH domain-containing protein